MKFFFLATAFSAGLLLAPAARAQSMVPNGQNGPEVQPKAPTPDFAPPAIPGAGIAPGIATAPKVAKADQGDPTTELFTAINANDYTSAQDAISRGADLTAQNKLGETPLDLSIALNQNSITFLLLGARNEDGPPVPAAAEAATATTHHHVYGYGHATPASLDAPPAPTPAPRAYAPAAMGNNQGTPNASAGFLGFGSKN
jgi:hypothetical protein